MMTLREILTSLRRAWWLPAMGLVIGGLLGLAISLASTPLYTSRTQLFVSTTDSSSTADVFQGSQFSQQRVTSYAQLLTGEDLARRVIDRLGLQMSPEQLAAEVSAAAVPNTVLLDVSVTDPSAERARDIADAVGAEFTALAADLETPANAAVSPVKVTVVERADLPAAPSEPRLERNVALGLVVGLLIGGGTAVARTRLDRSVRDPEEAAALGGAPLIGTVLRDSTVAKKHVITRSTGSRVAEDYRRLRTNLQFINIDEPPKVIMVTSAVPSEGKTTLTINLALALAEAGRRVTLVEADLRRPRVTQYLGLVGDVGVTNILVGTAELDDVIQPYDQTGMFVVGSGPNPPNPGELLASRQMSTLIDKLRAANDFVIIDAPPLLPVADATGMSAFVDGVLLVVRYGSTRKEQVRQAAAALERVRAKTLGVILNIVSPRTETGSAYGYGYGYDYGYRSSGHRKSARRRWPRRDAGRG